MSVDTGTQIRQIQIINAAMSTERVRCRMHRVIRGVLVPEHFDAIQVPPYQRVAMENEKHEDLKNALGPDGKGIPDDLLLCVRLNDGDLQNVGASTFVLSVEALWLLDGHQRWFAAMTLLSLLQATEPFGVKIILDTTLEEEVSMFFQVNREQTKVSTQVLLRNSGDNAAIAALRALEKEELDFPQVQWDQLRKPGDVITAHMLYEVAIILHGHSRPGTIEELLEGLEKVTADVGTELMAENVKTFFDVLEKIFGSRDLRRFMYRIDVMRALAMLFSNHEDFWTRKERQKLFVRAADIRKLAGIRHTRVEAELSTTAAANNLYHTLVRHVDSARDTKLVLREREK